MNFRGWICVRDEHLSIELFSTYHKCNLLYILIIIVCWILDGLSKPDHGATYHKQVRSQSPSQTGPDHHAEKEQHDFCRGEVCMVQQGLYGQSDATVLTVSVGVQ